MEHGCHCQMPSTPYSDKSVKICLAVIKSEVIIKLLSRQNNINETSGAVLVIIGVILIAQISIFISGALFISVSIFVRVSLFISAIHIKFNLQICSWKSLGIFAV